MTRSIIYLTLLFQITLSYGQVTPSLKEMWAIIQQQQKTIEQLKAQINGNTQIAKQQNQVIEVMSDTIDNRSSTSQSQYKFGGYGEVHYGNTNKGNSIDAHRFVLFNGYDFNDRTRFYSELEVEHGISGEAQPGEVEVEQAFIEHLLSDSSKITAGISLMPIGIINETHEPNTFYGVERNSIEKNIIPTTWWAAGIGFSQNISSSLGYDVFIGEGLNTPISGSDAFLIRKGRQGAAKAKANDGSLTARVRFNPANDLQVNASFQYQKDITQGTLGIDATLFEINAQYQINGFGLKALYARWDLDDKVRAIAVGREQQIGYFIEPAYRFGQANQYGIFTRYSHWDNNAGNDNTNDAITQLDLGVNYWLTPQVVFKVDYQNQSGPKNEEGFHLGMGYSF